MQAQQIQEWVCLHLSNVLQFYLFYFYFSDTFNTFPVQGNLESLLLWNRFLQQPSLSKYWESAPLETSLSLLQLFSPLFKKAVYQIQPKLLRKTWKSFKKKKKAKQQEERPPDNTDYFYRIYVNCIIRKKVTNTNKSQLKFHKYTFHIDVLVKM